jgi:hypothetical protein
MRTVVSQLLEGRQAHANMHRRKNKTLGDLGGRGRKNIVETKSSYRSKHAERNVRHRYYYLLSINFLRSAVGLFRSGGGWNGCRVSSLPFTGAGSGATLPA